MARLFRSTHLQIFEYSQLGGASVGSSRPKGDLVLWGMRSGRPRCPNAYSSPSIAEDGTIYLGSWDHCLYALSKEGELKWSFTTGLYVSSSPAFATDGTIYFGSQDRYFYALFADGSLKWKLWTDSPFVSEGAVVICTKNGVIAIGENNGRPARSGWPMLLGNARRNGRQGDPAVVGRSTRRESELKTLNGVEAIRSTSGPLPVESRPRKDFPMLPTTSSRYSETGGAILGQGTNRQLFGCQSE
jgi:hypothetical protein